MFRRIKKMVGYTRLLKSSHPELRVTRISNDTHLNQAKSLHAQVYLQNGYIEPSHLNAHGVMPVKHDPYQEHSVYFAVIEKLNGKERVVATARQIEEKTGRGHSSFPTMDKLALHPNVLEALGALNPKDCVEISALAKERGYTTYASFMIYRALWQHSIRSRHQVWLMACDARVYKHLKFLFRDSLVQVGPRAHYMGSDVVPAVLEVDRSLDVLIQNSKSINPVLRGFHRQLISFFLEGLPVRFLKPRQLTDLNLGLVKKLAEEF